MCNYNNNTTYDQRNSNTVPGVLRCPLCIARPERMCHGYGKTGSQPERRADYKGIDRSDIPDGGKGIRTRQPTDKNIVDEMIIKLKER